MEFQTIFLRFRDLITEDGTTIERHAEVIRNKGYVWWGWWKKGNETTPYDELSILRAYVEEKPTDLYLVDSGQRKLYRAKCSDMKYTKDQKKESPDSQYTPEYYNKQQYYAWFKFTEIKECDINSVKDYTYVQVDSLFKENHFGYEKFYGKRIFDIQEMIQQNRTLWFVRKYDKEKDFDYEISLLDNHVVEPHDFSDKYYETGSDTLLWLSDLHFGTDDVFKVKMEADTDVTLTEHIQNAYETDISSKFENLGGLLVTGDITSYGKEEGFAKAKDFLQDINRRLVRKLTSENIIFCPGNHDFVRIDKELRDEKPKKVSDNPNSIKAYSEFYNSIHNLKPNEYMACGRKLLMASGRTVEIVALNSLILQQYKDFEGHGYLSGEQLKYVAGKMGWKEGITTNSIRIAIMHHHYLPTCLIEEIDVNKPSSVVYDAERLMQWLAKYDVKFLLHGHKHQSFIKKIGHVDNSQPMIELGEEKNVYVIGMGGTGAHSCENKFATLDFMNDKIVLKYFTIYSDCIQKDKCIQTINIPI